jgi:mannosyl-oligosaccharide alpha-1,2-mannosidase
MGVDEVVSEAGLWIETHLSDRISKKGQVNLFETTIRVLGGLLSAYHFSGGEQGTNLTHKGPKPTVYLETARNLADRLLLAFTSSPTSIPFSDVVLHDPSAHRAPDGLSSTAEVSTVQLEFNYLSTVSGDPRYSIEAMKVLEHIKDLPKVEGLVPIYIRYGPCIKQIHLFSCLHAINFVHNYLFIFFPILLVLRQLLGVVN